MQDDQIKQARQAFPLQTLSTYQLTTRLPVNLQAPFYVTRTRDFQANTGWKLSWREAPIRCYRNETNPGVLTVKTAANQARCHLGSDVHKLKHNRLWRLGCDPWRL